MIQTLASICAHYKYCMISDAQGCLAIRNLQKSEALGISMMRIRRCSEAIRSLTLRLLQGSEALGTSNTRI